MVVLPELGRPAPIPSITTLAATSDDCHDRVTGTPEHAVFVESEIVRLGNALHWLREEPPGVVARLRLLATYGAEAFDGEKFIDVTG
jgi:hypothetical protein